jgi:ABC-type histidine transport system ATPase subunit
MVLPHTNECPHPPEPMIAMVDVHKWTGDLHVLKGVSLTVRS